MNTQHTQQIIGAVYMALALVYAFGWGYAIGGRRGRR